MSSRGLQFYRRWPSKYASIPSHSTRKPRCTVHDRADRPRLVWSSLDTRNQRAQFLLPAVPNSTIDVKHTTGEFPKTHLFQCALKRQPESRRITWSISAEFFSENTCLHEIIETCSLFHTIWHVFCSNIFILYSKPYFFIFSIILINLTQWVCENLSEFLNFFTFLDHFYQFNSMGLRKSVQICYSSWLDPLVERVMQSLVISKKYNFGTISLIYECITDSVTSHEQGCFEIKKMSGITPRDLELKYFNRNDFSSCVSVILCRNDVVFLLLQSF